MATNSSFDSPALTTNSEIMSSCETKSGDNSEQGCNGSVAGKDENEVFQSSEDKPKKKNVFEIDRNKIKMIPGSASQVGELQVGANSFCALFLLLIFSFNYLLNIKCK